MEVHVRVCRDCGEEYRPEIAVCADCGGELEDVYSILKGFGTSTLRLRTQRYSATLKGWVKPQRLLVVSGRRALNLGPPGGVDRHCATMAVLAEPSRTLRSRVEAMGFDSDDSAVAPRGLATRADMDRRALRSGFHTAGIADRPLRGSQSSSQMDAKNSKVAYRIQAFHTHLRNSNLP